MLLTPFFCAAVLLRRVYWIESVILIAILCAFAIKEPLLIVARQRWIWKQEHPETGEARRWIGIELTVLSLCGLALAGTKNWRSFAVLSVSAGAFTAAAVIVNLRNRQRSEWFQVSSAFALTSASLAGALATGGIIAARFWILWLLCALQATAGIFVVHARIDARIALRTGSINHVSRSAALLCQAMLFAASAFFFYEGRMWIVAALLIAAAGYLFELRRQRDPASLQMPLTLVGRQALALSLVYSVLVIVGLW